VATPADWRVLVAVAGAALLFDFAVRSGALGVGASGVIASAALMVWARVSGRWARGCAALAALAGVGLSLRASPWLQAGDLAAAVSLLVIATAIGRGGSPFDIRVRRAVGAAWQTFLHLLAAPAFLLPPARTAGGNMVGGSRDLLVAVLRGALIGIPVIAVLVALLASADPVFASFLNINIDPADLSLHIFLWVTGAWLVGGLLRAASGEHVDSPTRASWQLGAPEVITALVLLDLVFVAFALAQLASALGAGGDALRAAGVTYSDYARSGFFQLLWVAGITFVSLLALAALVRAESPTSRKAFKVLGLVAVALTLVILAVAWRRLALYEDAYGWTMLRFYSHAFAAWIAVAFCLLAAWIAGTRPDRRTWIYGATATAGLGALLVLNLVNPEALVVRFNVARSDTATFDPQYLGGLSSDAVAESLSPDVPGRFAVRLRAAACSAIPLSRDWAALNLSSVTADVRRREACR
jgi:hypothetical protein